MMVSELATAIPDEGGFYIWVRRGMGRFWGFQETWLSLAGSVFEMALYPNLCIAYIGRFAPRLVAGHRGLILGFAMIANLHGVEYFRGALGRRRFCMAQHRAARAVRGAHCSSRSEAAGLGAARVTRLFHCAMRTCLAEF